MREYVPDKWVVVKFNHEGEDVYKVFATWSGGYTHGSSWKLNSGITHAELVGNHYAFYGYSGSVYKCHVDNYGLSMYGASILDGVPGEILDENTDFLSVKYTKDQK